MPPIHILLNRSDLYGSDLTVDNIRAWRDVDKEVGEGKEQGNLEKIATSYQPES